MGGVTGEEDPALSEPRGLPLLEYPAVAPQDFDLDLSDPGVIEDVADAPDDTARGDFLLHVQVRRNLPVQPPDAASNVVHQHDPVHVERRGEPQPTFGRERQLSTEVRHEEAAVRSPPFEADPESLARRAAHSVRRDDVGRVHHADAPTAIDDSHHRVIRPGPVEDQFGGRPVKDHAELMG